MKRKLYYIAISILFIIPAVFSQNTLIDSLQKVLVRAKSDSQRVNILTDLCWEYQYYDIDKAFEYGNRALELAQSIDFKKGIANATVALGSIYDEKGDYNKALKNYKQALVIRQLLEDSKGIASLYNNIGGIYYKKGNYDIALENYNKSLTINKKLNDKKQIAASLLNIGQIYEDKGDNSQALSFYIQANKAYEEDNNNVQGIAFTLSKIGNIYISMKLYSKALESYSQAQAIHEKTGNKKGYASCLRSIGMVYRIQKEYNKALDYFKNALRISEENNDPAATGEALGNLGNCYLEMSRFREAYDHYKRALAINEELGNSLLIANLKHNLGVCLEKMGKKEEAMQYFQQSLSEANALGSKELIMDNYGKIAQLYASSGNYNLAYDFHVRFFQMYDSLNNEETKKILADLQTKFETEKKQKEIELLNKDKELKDLQIKKQEEVVRNQTFLIYAIASGFLLILVFSVVLYRQFQHKKRANALLAEQKREIELQAAELEKLSIVARDTDNAVLIADANGVIEWVNEGFHRMFGYNLDEFKATFGNTIQQSSSNQEIEKFFKICTEKKQSVDYISFSQNRLGEGLWVQTTLTPILDKEGNVIKLIAIDSDITKIKEAEAEIAKQKDEIEKKNLILNRAYQIIEIKNKNITDSIRYAERIQKAFLPSYDKMNRILPESFVLYLPKDIVSGDFYWVEKKGENILFSAIDCTGHGVPGAFMSIMAYSLLNQAINDSKVCSPADILNFVSEGLYNTLSNQNEDYVKVGMDLVLCCYKPQTMMLEFAGVHNPLYIVREGAVLQFKSDSYPIGEPMGEHFSGYTNTQIHLMKGDCIYIFSDGYIDQFGGPHRKKFMSNRFRSLLSEIYQLPMLEQKAILHKKFNEWKGTIEQYDDVCILGVRI